jgi:hypothetical protein
MYLHFPGLDLQVQDIVDQRQQQVLARRADFLEVGELALSPRVFGVLARISL